MNETVLVVDDEERIRSSLRGILGDEGFRVLDTGDPAGVMNLIARENPALVLLDIWMPNIDGIELLRRIKAERPEVRVIMISGHGNIQNAVAARLENVTDTGYNTTLTASGRSVRTVEHLMSALHGMGISNLLIKTDDEVPALDGSAIEFCRQISEVGVEEQEAAVEPVRIAGDHHRRG